MNSDRTSQPGIYYVRVRGKIHGPFDVEKLKKLRARGQFSRAHEVSTDRRTWQPAATVEEIFSNAEPPSLLSQAGDNVFLPQDLVRESPAEPAAGPPGNARWFYSIGDEQHGPVSLIDLRQLLRNGQLTVHDLVWKEGMADWVPVANQPDLLPPQQPTMGQPGWPTPAATGLEYRAAQRPRTSGLATASIMLGLIGLGIVIGSILVMIFGARAFAPTSVTIAFIGFCVCGGFCSVLAIVFGAMALRDIGGSRGLATGRGMALSGLILGVLTAVVLGTFILLILLGLVAVALH